jgi:integrase
MVYTVNRKEVRESTGQTDFGEAQKVLTTRLAEIAHGTYVAPDRARLTLGEILRAVITRYERDGLRSLATVRGHVHHLTTGLGAETAVLGITTEQVDRLVSQWRAEGFSPATCNRRIAILRRAYRLAKIRLDPARLDFSDLFLPEDSTRGRYMAPNEAAKIVAHLPAYLRPFFEFSYLCGVRKQQLARTTIDHVNTSTWTITWAKAETKAKADHVIHLDGRPLELIQAQLAAPREGCRSLFHGRGCGPGHVPSQRYSCMGDFKRAWKTAVIAAGFAVGRKSGFIWHNTRHSAVTNLVNAGVPKHEAKATSGHHSDEVFARYQIGTEHQQRAALRAVTLYQQQQQQRAGRVVPFMRTRRRAAR